MKTKPLSSSLLKILIFFFSCSATSESSVLAPPCWNIVPKMTVHCSQQDIRNSLDIVARPRVTQSTTPCHNRQVIQVLRAHHVSKEPAGSTQSKQWWTELLYRYTTSRITALNIRKLYNNSTTLSAIVYFELSPLVPLKNHARAHNTWKPVYYINSWTYCEPSNGVLLITRCGFE